MNEKPDPIDKPEMDADDIAKKSLGSVLQFVRSTHGFPSAGDDFEFYSSFTGFRDFVADQKASLLKGITQLLANQGLKVKITHFSMHIMHVLNTVYCVLALIFIWIFLMIKL